MDSDIQNVITFGNEEREKSSQLWDEEWVNGYYRSTDGVQITDERFIRTKNFISVTPNATYFITNPVNFDIYGFNGGTFVGIIKTGKDTSFTIPSNVNQIGFNSSSSGTTTYTKGTCMLNEGSAALPYQPYHASKHITDDEAELLKQEEEKCSQLFDKSKAIIGYYKDTNNVTQTRSDYFYSDFIEIKPNTIYTFSGKTMETANWTLFYNADKQFLGPSYNAAQYTFTTPSSAYYAVFNGLRTELDTIMLNKGSEAKPYQQYAGEILHTSSELLFENIVDKNGNHRFVEGAGDDLTISGVAFTYNKWSLSGSHLMTVVCAQVANGITLAHDTMIGQFELPRWIEDKIVPVFSNVGVSILEVKLYGASFSTEANPLVVNAVVNKTTHKLQFFVSGNTTMTADRSFRMQLDLLIDNE